MNPILMNKRFYIITLLIFVHCLQSGMVMAQNNRVKQFDRKKWNELVDEIKRKRYDAREKEPEYNSKEIEFSDQNGEYSEYSDARSEYNSGTGDGGIYGTSTDDETFFDKTNDRNGTGSGDDVNPKYNDPDENGNVKKDNSYADSKDYRPVDRDYQSRQVPVQHYSKSTSESAAGGGSSLWLIIILVAVLAAAVIYMIIASSKSGNKKVAVPETTLEKMENMTITKSELELALEAALKDKNYREAVRIYFIAVIKEMKDHSWIRWEKKKTNYHYINEITGRPQQPDFVTATRAFEIVWYGNRSMAEGDYYQVEPLFKRLLTSIQ
ncbi:MAG TPA: DUF4129 domain-containing protein [Flavobacteriales bacterium]|nr:DUF4129 domain-containing protein [Flavobacteriales bacterium]